MSHHCPTLQWLCHLLPWQHPPWTHILALLIPMGPYKARGIGCALVAVCSFVWGAKRNTSKIRERDVTLALGGHLLVWQHNNQPKVGVCGRRDVGEGAQPGRNMWGRRHTIVWGGELSKKNCRGIKWLPMDISNATTNQKHSGVTEERKARRFDRGRAWRKRDSIVLVAKESGGM